MTVAELIEKLRQVGPTFIVRKGAYGNELDSGNFIVFEETRGVFV